MFVFHTNYFHRDTTSPTEECRPGSEEMNRLMTESMMRSPSNLELTTTTEHHGDDGGEFEVIIPKPNLMDILPEVITWSSKFADPN